MDKSIFLQQLTDKEKNFAKRDYPTEIAKKIGVRNIWIYGAGNFGKRLYNILKLYKIDIEGFLDKKAPDCDKIDAKSVINPMSPEVSSDCKENAIIIISIFSEQTAVESIKTDLLNWGYKNIIFYYDLALPFDKIAVDISETKGIEFYKEHCADIIRANDLLDDEKSKRIYEKYIDAYSSRDLSKFERADYEPQYFANDVPSVKGTARFIDCGAFDGDSVRSLVKNKGKAESIALFEPSKQTRDRLYNFLRDSQSNLAENIVVFPCGVWDKSEILCFNNNDEEKASANSVCKDGNEYVQCVSIDEVLVGFHPTFIKMDIEGAEYNALLGAKETIIKNKPDLAICLYHRVEDLWNIPLLIDSWNLNYKFNIRTYRMYGYETVLYATSKN